MSPYEAEEIDPMAEPCAAYYDPWRGPSAAYHGQNRQQRPGRSAKAPSRVAPPVIRNIIVTDGNESQKPEHNVKDEAMHDTSDKQEPRKPRFENTDAAANCIQRRYRGHRVRKTAPMKQLRIIKEVQNATKTFQAQACDPEFLGKLREDRMERLRFDEGLMREVLKLDSLQEVHPFVRDVRKAATRDLVRLQDATEAAVESGRPITPDDLNHVDMPVDAPEEGETDVPDEGDTGMAIDDGTSLPEVDQAAWSAIKPVPL